MPQRPPPWLAWVTSPAAALKVLALPILLSFNWQLVARYVSPPIANPFAPFFTLGGYVDGSDPADPRYGKTLGDVAFLAYYVVFFSLCRQLVVFDLGVPVARFFGLRKPAKILRYGEQLYALLYYSAFGAWGYRIAGQLPTWWYQTEHFWLGYPVWALTPELKRYYLMQFSYWLQQLVVLLLGLEKPRSDHRELMGHHAVTLWLITWSYMVNMTLIGHAVFLSMDIPDAFFAASKLLNYMQWNRAKIVSFVIFISIWTYFRHYLNLRILYSVLFEYKLAPAWTRAWIPSQGVYLRDFLPRGIFVSLSFLQLLNLYWYYLMWRILIKAIITKEATDDRSDAEDDADDKED